jgi:hypothetical protein
MNSIILDKHASLSKKFGRFIQEQRVKIFQESELEFAQRLNSYSESDIFSETIVKSLESGDGNLSFAHWLFAWQLMQVADKAVESTKSDTQLFLAASERLHLSTEDVLRKTPK